MSVKERLHHLIEELPEADLLVAERMLRGLKLPAEEAPAGPARRLTAEERRASEERLRALVKGNLGTADYLREKHEEIEREEEEFRQRWEGRA